MIAYQNFSPSTTHRENFKKLPVLAETQRTRTYIFSMESTQPFKAKLPNQSTSLKKLAAQALHYATQSLHIQLNVAVLSVQRNDCRKSRQRLHIVRAWQVPLTIRTQCRFSRGSYSRLLYIYSLPFFSGLCIAVQVIQVRYKVTSKLCDLTSALEFVMKLLLVHINQIIV